MEIITLSKVSQTKTNIWYHLYVEPKKSNNIYFFFTTSSLSYAAAAAAKSLQSCPTLCDPIDGYPPGSPVPGILQARTLEWAAISFSKAWKWKVKVKSLSRVRLLATPWTAAYQAPPSMGFSRQEYWTGVPLPSLHHMLPGGYLWLPTECEAWKPLTGQLAAWFYASDSQGI